MVRYLLDVCVCVCVCIHTCVCVCVFIAYLFVCMYALHVCHPPSEQKFNHVGVRTYDDMNQRRQPWTCPAGFCFCVLYVGLYECAVKTDLSASLSKIVRPCLHVSNDCQSDGNIMSVSFLCALQKAIFSKTAQIWQHTYPYWSEMEGGIDLRMAKLAFQPSIYRAICARKPFTQASAGRPESTTSI